MIPSPSGRWSLGAFWFFYMAAMGIFLPNFSLYLQTSLGLSGSEVGRVLATIPLVTLLTQSIWGRLSDLSGRRTGILAVACAAGALSLGLFFFVESYGGALAATAVFACFQLSVWPLVTAVTLAVAGDSGFGPIRVWGTLGFLTAVVIFPRLMTDLASMFPAMAALLAVASLVALVLPRTGAVALRSPRGDTRWLWRHRPVVKLLVLVVAIHLVIQAPIFFFPLFIEARGGTVQTVGNLWVLMLLLEIPLIATSGRVLRRMGARGLLALGLASEAVRWTVCAWTEDFGWVAAVQVLHGLGVLGLLVGAPLYLEQAAPERLRSTGQALVSMAGLGLGAMLSHLLGGWVFEHLGSSVLYAFAGAGAGLLLLLLPWWLPPPTRPALPDRLDATIPTAPIYS